METIYESISTRTGGNIYVGVVGPVRTGKSTLIKRFMETLVIPNIEDPYRRERARDELPQSGSGKTIMTAEPKFVPEEAVEIRPDGKCTLRVRMIDSVGYMVAGAVGAEEDGVPRMVTTPWYDHEIPMPQAAELGTQKVMQDHCSIGLVVTTDGSITDIPRQDYLEAEAKAIRDMQATGKPFLIIINTRDPGSESARAVQDRIQKDFCLPSHIADCQALDEGDIRKILLDLLYAFPLQEIRIHLPRWIGALEPDHPVKANLSQALMDKGKQITTLGSAESILSELRFCDPILDVALRNVDLSTGQVTCSLTFPEALFYEILSEKAGMPIENDAELLALLTELSTAKREYDTISDALSAVKTTGYGIVMPTAEEMQLEAPELLRKNGTFGVKLRATAPSIHMMRIDIDTEITPMVGDEQQSRDLMSHLGAESTKQLWESNIFGKSVLTLVQEGLNAKLIRTPEEVRSRFRGTLCRIINEGASGLICFIL